MKKVYVFILGMTLALPSSAQLNQLWASQYNNTSGWPASLDNANKTISDGFGNTYVTGCAHNNVTTIKYDVSGNQVWVQTYNGPYNGADAGNSLALDNLGNLYVVGYEGVGTGVSSDMLTIKYDTAGNFQWSRKVSGTNLTGFDQARAVTCDAAGNIYVTGLILNLSVYEDMTTLKYDAAGNLIWTKILNGAGGGNDAGMDIALDASNNVFVAGYLSGTTTLTKGGLVKYDNAGVQQWAVSALGNTGYDFWSDVLIAPDGLVYVAGSYDAGGMGINGRVARYNPVNGTAMWTTYFNNSLNGTDQFRKLVLDVPSGSIYVAGNARNPATGGNEEMVTAKYDTAGVFQWIRYNTGSAAAADQGTDITLDGAGNIWTCGYVENSSGSRDLAVSQYNPAGTQLYFDMYNDAYNNYEQGASLVYYNNAVYVAGFTTKSLTSRDYLYVKYNVAGSRTWVQTYYPTHSPNDVSNAVATDLAGNIYIAGTTVTSASSYNDILVLKYNSAGVFQWQYTYSGSSGFQDDKATGIAVDNAGNVYVSGYVVNTGAMKDGAAIKLNSAGVQQWVSVYNNPAQNRDDAFNAIRVDASGNVYVTGYRTVTAGGATDIVTVKYNSAGVQQWAPTYTGTATTSNDIGNDLEVDALGNVFVTGKATFTASLDDIMIIKYSSAGAQTWAWNYLSSTNYNDMGKFIRLAPNGNLYVAGYKDYSYTLKDMITIRYNASTGAAINTAVIVNNNGDEVPNGLAVDANNNVYVSGSASTVGMGTDMLTVAYSPAMAQKWIKTKSGNSSPISNDVGNAVSVSTAFGKVYAAGTIENGPLNYKDMAIVVYDTLGNELNYVTIANSQGTYDYPTAIIPDTSKNIAVVGWFGWNTDTDILLAKYCNPASVGSFATASSSVCPGDAGVNYTVNAVTGAISYVWMYGGSGVTITGTGTSVTLDFALTATSDTLFVYAVNDCGIGNPLKYYITVKPKPNVLLEFLYPAIANDTVCEGTLVSFHPDGTGWSSLLWSPGAFTNTGNRAYYIDSSMTITIIGTSSGGCKDTASISMYTLPVPSADYVSSATTITPGSVVNYNDISTGAPVQWNWTFQGGVPLNSTLEHPAGIVYPTPGSFTTKLVVTNAVGCKDSVSIPYYVNVSGSLPALNKIYSNGSIDYYMQDGAEAEKKYQLLAYNDGTSNGYVTKIDDDGDVLWTTKFNGTPVHLVAVADSNHYYVGSILPKTGGNYTTITMLNQSGTMVWQRKFNDPGSFVFQATDINAAKNKDALIMIKYVDGSVNGHISMRVDTLGNLLWAKSALPPQGMEPAKIIETMKGDIIALSSAYSPSTYSFSMVKYSAAGALLWHKNVGNTLLPVYNVHVRETADSSFVLYGDDALPIMGPGNNLIVAKADKNGNGLWAKSLNFGPGGYMIATGLGLQSNGNIGLGVSYYDADTDGTGYHETSLALYGFDSAMDTLKWNTWIKGSINYGMLDYLNLYKPVMKPMFDGDFAVYTTFHNFSTDLWSPMMMRANVNGSFEGCYQDTLMPVVASRTVTAPGPSLTYGTYPLAAQAYSNTFGTIPLTSIICSGGVITSAMENGSEGLMQVYPNPATAELNVILPEEGGTITIYNAIGSVVKRMEVSNAAMRMDLSAFNSGIYLLEWMKDGVRQVSRIMKN